MSKIVVFSPHSKGIIIRKKVQAANLICPFYKDKYGKLKKKTRKTDVNLKLRSFLQCDGCSHGAHGQQKIIGFSLVLLKSR